jgi:hypothetical protein
MKTGFMRQKSSTREFDALDVYGTRSGHLVLRRAGITGGDCRAGAQRSIPAERIPRRARR